MLYLLKADFIYSEKVLFFIYFFMGICIYICKIGHSAFNQSSMKKEIRRFGEVVDAKSKHDNV